MRGFWIAACVIVVTLVVGGCESSSKPTSPSAVAPAQAIIPSGLGPEATGTAVVPVSGAVTYILSGLIFEMTASGRRPVEAVELYCDSCGSPVGHTFTASDARGRYQFAWSTDGRHPLLVWKDGYALANSTGSYGREVAYVTATVNGDTQFDIEVVRR